MKGGAAGSHGRHQCDGEGRADRQVGEGQTEGGHDGTQLGRTAHDQRQRLEQEVKVFFFLQFYED